MTNVKEIPGAFIFPLAHQFDIRGSFIKLNLSNAESQLVSQFNVQDEYITLSKKNTIRGMHFQIPPFQHDKLIYCVSGEVIDVLVDLRPGDNYGNIFFTKLSGRFPQGLFVPVGVAHGFLSIEDDTVMVYKTSSPHSPECDLGILWSSINFDWECSKPILSRRDQGHIRFSDFITPFK
jgi:dTDP-4-dehydrorhamnose 3,5-epimerase/CDP-3, 6-dideoxy-D-glycero-D-glycero-4-hexulose-5-epimerase